MAYNQNLPPLARFKFDDGHPYLRKLWIDSRRGKDREDTTIVAFRLKYEVGTADMIRAVTGMEVIESELNRVLSRVTPAKPDEPKPSNLTVKHRHYPANAPAPRDSEAEIRLKGSGVPFAKVQVQFSPSGKVEEGHPLGKNDNMVGLVIRSKDPLVARFAMQRTIFMLHDKQMITDQQKKDACDKYNLPPEVPLGIPPSILTRLTRQSDGTGQGL